MGLNDIWWSKDFAVGHHASLRLGNAVGRDVGRDDQAVGDADQAVGLLRHTRVVGHDYDGLPINK